jgi:class 3 adenylate cyclase
VRLTLSLKLSIIGVLLVVIVAGVTSYLMVFRFGETGEQELVARDRELAKVLAGLRTAQGKLDFDTIASFVGSSDKADTGLVYAVETDRGGKMVQGALNPRLFAAMDSEFETRMREGRRRVLELLAAGKVDRRGKIKEYALSSPSGQLRLGFNLQRIQRQIQEQQSVALSIIGAGLALGILVAVLLARRLSRPVRQLAGAMEAVARGDLDQTVQVASSDELASLAQSFNHMTRALRDVGRVRELFALYVTPEVASRLLKETNPLEMVAEERSITAVSVCLHEFTRVARAFSLRERMHLLNEYLAPIIDALLVEGAVVEPPEGERLLAVWGAPNDVTDPEMRAIRATLAARAAVEQEGRRQSAAGGVVLQLRAGICTGRAVAGNIGSAARVTYRVLGDAVDLARAVEQLAQPGEVLLAEATYNKVRDRLEARAALPLILDHLEEAVPLYRVD